MQSISNRCMYCGAALPKEHHLSEQEKNQLIMEKFARFKEHEENADEIISSIRSDFGIPAPRKKKKNRKQRKKENEAAVAAVITTINTHSNGGGNSGC